MCLTSRLLLLLLSAACLNSRLLPRHLFLRHVAAAAAAAGQHLVLAALNFLELFLSFFFQSTNEQVAVRYDGLFQVSPQSR